MRVYQKKSGRAARCVIATWRTRLLGMGTISFPSENKGPPSSRKKLGCIRCRGVCLQAVYSWESSGLAKQISMSSFQTKKSASWIFRRANQSLIESDRIKDLCFLIEASLSSLSWNKPPNDMFLHNKSTSVGLVSLWNWQDIVHAYHGGNNSKWMKR